MSDSLARLYRGVLAAKTADPEVSRTARLLMIVVVLPFFTSIIVRTYAWMVLLGRNGIVNESLTALGLTDKPLALLYNQARSRS